MAAKQEVGPVTPTTRRPANKGVMALLASSTPWPIGDGTDESCCSTRSRNYSMVNHEHDTDELVDMLTLLEDPLGLSLFRR